MNQNSNMMGNMSGNNRSSISSMGGGTPMNQNSNMMGNMSGNNRSSISSMGGGTPITHLRKDVALLNRPAQSNDVYNSTDSEKDDRIRDIVDDINIELEDDIKKKKKDKVDTDTTDEEEEKKDKKDKKKKSKKESTIIPNIKVPEFFKDGVLIWILYMLMSQNFFKKLIGKYLNSINPSEEGVVSNLGVAMYGLILVTLFTLIKIIAKQIGKY
jgi:hypothetical protein